MPDMKNRREFLKNGLIVCLGAGGVLSGCAAHSVPQSGSDRWGLIIDMERCTGCQSCMVACKLQSHTVSGRFHTTVADREVFKGDRNTLDFTTNMCRHCSNAPCVSACPSGAAYKDISGLVLTDWNRCDGNGACIQACPYHVRFADPRFENRADKCDLCVVRLNQGLFPACVENCPSGARIFGRFDSPEEEFARYLALWDIPTTEAQRRSAVIIHYSEKKGPAE